MAEVVHDADAALAATVALAMEEEARVGLVAPKFFKMIPITGPTLAHKITKFPVTSDAGTLTDGTALSNTSIDPTAITITAAGVGLATDVTDFSALGSLLDVQAAIDAFTRATINKLDVDAAALLDNFSSTAGATTVNLSVANLLTAYYTLMNAKEMKNPVFILHPIQYSDVQAEIVASSAPVFATDVIQEGFLKLLPGDPNYRGTFMGIPVYTDPNCPESGGAGQDDRGGALFAAGRALALGWKWAMQAETLRNVKMVATSVAVSACYGVAEVWDGAGVSIITDHE